MATIPNFQLKVIFTIHFTFIALSCLGTWDTSAYLYYNLLYTLALLWSIYQHDSEEPLQIALIINGISIVLDILLLVFSYPSNEYVRAREKFSAAMAILHLIVRPASCVILLRLLQERNGTSGSIGGILSGRNPNYEDMDRTPPQTSGQTASYDYTGAQQI